MSFFESMFNLSLLKSVSKSVNKVYCQHVSFYGNFVLLVSLNWLALEEIEFLWQLFI